MKHRKWASAFARQATSDLDAREILAGHPKLPQCHQFHYLHMAFEKASKAHLIAGGATHESLMSHGYVEKVIPIVVKDVLGRVGETKQPWIMREVSELAKRINRLHPSIDSQTTPANCEYPWEDPKGEIIAPADYAFSVNDYTDKILVKVIKAVRQRLAELA